MNRLLFIYITSFCLLGLILPGTAQVPVTAQRTAATPVTLPAAYTKTAYSSVRTWIPAMITSDENLVFDSSRSTADVKLTTQYLDGFGRPLQTVERRISPNGNDMVTAFVYDSLGRRQYQYLPFVQEQNGKIKSDPFAAQASFYQDVSLNPGIADEHVYYSQTEYEASPLNRVLKTWAPGDSWAKSGGNHPIETQYYYNTIADSVRIWKIAISSTTCSGNTTYGTGSAVIPVTSDIYAAGQLIKSSIIDEAGHQTIEYKDKEDHVILKKIQLADAPENAHVGWLCTYYVYDDMNNLRFVIPPLAVQNIMSPWTISQTIADELCYQYQFDGRGRMISKKIPGAGSLYMAYDSRNRLVFTQDSLQRQKSTPEWLTTFYDGLNRPYETAIYTTASTRENLQCSITTNLDDTSVINLSSLTGDLVVTSYNSADTPYQATNSIIFDAEFTTPDNAEVEAIVINDGITSVVSSNPVPVISSSVLTPLTYTYYDNYNYSGVLSFVSSNLSKLQAGDNPYSQANTSSSTRVTTLTTGTKVRILGTDQWLTTTNYFDDDARTIQTIADNHTGGKDMNSLLYDYNGKVLSTYLTHTNPSSTVTPQTTVLTQMGYDAAGHLISLVKRLNDSTNLEEKIAENTYNELGQLQQKKIGVTASGQLDTLTYTYNIKGWLAGINKAFVNSTGTENWFGEEISYDDGFDSSQYNGNIAGIKWKTRSNGIPRAYGFGYDGANRLKKAVFNQQNTTGAAWTSDKADFTVGNLVYDANGNISSMKQQGLIGTTNSNVDNLTYTYQAYSNKLLTVTDASNTSTAKLGDFNDGTNTGDDYTYNGNGNLISDQNKHITAISYNLLNLPEKILVSGKGTINYLYTADGRKLKKTVVDSTSSPVKTTVTDYIEGLVYEQDTLRYIIHEEGRIRPEYDSGKALVYHWDYFEQDHLGNVRVVLGDNADTSIYAATMETASSATENALFSNIDNIRTALPAGYPTDETTNPNAYVARLNAESGEKIGPSIVLRVMAGDTLQLGVKAFYKSTAASTSSTTTSSMLAALVQAFSSSTISDGTHAAAGTNSAISSAYTSSEYEELISKDADENLATKPRAYLTYVLFDDLFNMVDDNSGVKQVQGNPDELQTLTVEKFVIKKTGFVYIYTSNESGENVYFDNLVVLHNKGPLLEETHYYPFGLTMEGISSKAANTLVNKRKWNKGSELQDKEFSDGSGLELYSTFYRSLDPQIGRFWQIDPKPDYAQSLYTSMNNNPIKFNDPLGDTARIHFRTGFLGLGKRKAVDYNNGALTNTDGTAYIGKVKGFLRKAVGGLDNLRTGANGNQLVTDIQNSNQTVNIIKGSGNSFSANDVKTGMTNVVRWNPGNTQGGPDAALNQNRPAFIGLGHELAHSWDQVFDGRIDYSAWYIPTGATTAVPRAELFSTHIENLLRAEHGINLRAFYSIGRNAAGAIIGEGPVLIPGTQQNANTITANGLNLVNPIY
jgi:RHS repeat-associated protein